MKLYLYSRPPEPQHLLFTRAPLWKIPRALAESHCSELNSYDAKYFRRHHCRFEIEEVEPGRFALVCPDHPGFDNRVMRLGA
jgi:hypothetical protein